MTPPHQTQALTLLTQLVAIPSPSRREAEAAAYLVGWMNDHGLAAYIDEAGSAVGVKGDGPQEILLLGHIDTFPGEVPVRREGDLLYGRGAVDAKGPLCAFAAATAQASVPPGWRITVVGAVEEEAATSKGARHVLAQRRGEEVKRRRGEEEDAKRRSGEEAKTGGEEEAKRRSGEEAKTGGEEEAKRRSGEEAKTGGEEEAKRQRREERKTRRGEEDLSSPHRLPASSPPSLPASSPPHLPASSPPSLPASSRPRLSASSPPHLLASSPPRFLASSPPPLPASPPAFCIIGEPSRWDRLTLGYKGRLLMDVVLRAPFSHSAGEGRLPAEQAVDFWRRVEGFCAEFNRARQATTPFDRLDPSLRHIASRDEGAFGRVELNLGFRLPPGLSPPDLEQQLRQLSQTLPEGTTAELQFSGGEPAYKSDKANPLVRAFLGAIRAAGGQPRFVVKTGTADMNVVGPHWPGTPIVAYGPGDSRLDHTPDEHIDLAEYLQAIAVLAEVLARLVG